VTADADTDADADADTVAQDIRTGAVAAVRIRYGNGARGAITVTTASPDPPATTGSTATGRRATWRAPTTGYSRSSPTVASRWRSRTQNPYERSGVGVRIDDAARAIAADRERPVPGRDTPRP